MTKEMKNEDVMSLMNDVHNVFFLKYRNLTPEDMSDGKWDEIVNDVGALTEKYKEFTHRTYKDGQMQEVLTAVPMIIWFLEILERRLNSSEKSNS